MSFLTITELFNYGLVLIFGLFLSTFIAGGWENRRQRNWIFISCPVFLITQGIFWSLWGTEMVEQIYPLIVHLPLLLILIFLLKKKVSVAIVSILTAYLCCELPRWINLMAVVLSRSALFGEIAYTISIVVLFLVLYRYFIPSIHDTICSSKKALLIFGSLPMAYYIYDYVSTVYFEILHAGIHALDEFLPTILVVFYVLLLSAYHTQQQKQAEAEIRHSMLEAELKQSETEIENLHNAEKQTAIYQHDMRHHLRMIGNLLSVGEIGQAEEYIHSVSSAVEAVTPKRFCENETVNLLISSFEQRANKAGTDFRAVVKLPDKLTIPDTELCAVISNGLDNAIRAATKSDRWIEFYCSIRHQKLLIEIKNPYSGKVIIKNDLPHSEEQGHGYGTKSIRSIAQHHHGLCTFETKNNIFFLRVVLPL